jgi:homoserine O-acetyltransferase
VYAGWAFSQTFYRDELYKKIGFDTIEDLLVDWENDHLENWDANDLLAKLATWQANDISFGPQYENDIKKALQSIRARAILIPCTQDLYFRHEDNLIEAQQIPNVEIRPYDSPWGHCAANPGNDLGFEVELDKGINDLLN